MSTKITSNLLTRSKAWSSITSRPHIDIMCKFFAAKDPFSAYSLCDVLEIDLLKDTCIAVDPKTGKSAYLAIPFKVTERASNVFGKMHGGLATTVIDVVTSFHMGEQKLPDPGMHVSTSLSTKYLSAGTVGAPLVAVSQIDKMGKRLLYSSLRIIEDPTETIINKYLEQTKSEEFCPDTDTLKAFIKQYDKVIVTGQHVKMFVDVNPIKADK